MSTAVGKCGCLCGICSLNKENLLTMEDKIRTSEGMSKYLNWTPKPDKLKQCWGCQSDQGFKYQPKCNMRICAIYNEIENCAYCSAFPCQDIQSYSRELVEKRIGKPVPEEDYKSFVKPYEGAKNLEKIKKNLTEDRIVKMKPYLIDLKIVDFPEGFVLPENELDAYRSIHGLLATIEPLKNLSYARAQVMKKERDYFVKLLWTMGIKGKIQLEGDKEHIKLASSDYFSEMKGTRFYSNYTSMQKRIDFLKNKGIGIELVPETDMDKILTPTKGLRKEGWSLEISFGDKLDALLGIKALVQYSEKLFKKHGKRGFRYFTRADMRVLI